MTPRLSKALLTSHITVSASWIGAVAVFIALAISSLTSSDIHLVRSAYLAMELSAWYVIVPFCFASLLTGIVQATATKWGLFNYYWIATKLFLTVVLTVLLLLHMQPIEYLAGLAKNADSANTASPAATIELIAKAGAAILALLFIMTISVYKPWGKIVITSKASLLAKVQHNKTWSSYAFYRFIALIVVVIIMHLLGGGMPRH